jgi:hypothetical protein
MKQSSSQDSVTHQVFRNQTGTSLPNCFDEPIHLPMDALCRLLSNSRRRAVIGRVATLSENEQTSIAVLAEQIIAEEKRLPRERVSSGQRKSGYVSLLQCHLPKLDDAGVVEWNQRSGAVSRGASIDELAGLISALGQTCTSERTTEIG